MATEVNHHATHWTFSYRFKPANRCHHSMEYDLFAARRRSLAQPGHDPAPGNLAHLSPLSWEHINLNGGLPLGNIADPRSRPIPAAPHRRACSRLACLEFRFVSSPPGADIDQGHRCVREYSARLLGHSPTIVPAVVWASQQWPATSTTVTNTTEQKHLPTRSPRMRGTEQTMGNVVIPKGFPRSVGRVKAGFLAFHGSHTSHTLPIPWPASETGITKSQSRRRPAFGNRIWRDADLPAK
jgi:hypothetical protein